MRLKALGNINHNGQAIATGEIFDVDEATAVTLIDSEVAVETDDAPVVADAVDEQPPVAPTEEAPVTEAPLVQEAPVEVTPPAPEETGSPEVTPESKDSVPQSALENVGVQPIEADIAETLKSLEPTAPDTHVS